MTLASKTVTATVVSFHRPIELEGLLHQLMSAVDQIVVVNVDNDPLVEDVVATIPGAVHVPLPNRGYAAAVNAGARYAVGDVVCFMNDDLSLRPEAIEHLARALDSHASVALPRIEDALGGSEPSLLALPTPWRLLLEWALTPDRRPFWAPQFLRLEKWRDPLKPAVVHAGTAALVAVDAEQLRNHRLPEEYFMYWEELEWFWDLRAAGLKIVYVPDAILQHNGGRDDIRPEKCQLLARNAVRCVRRTQGSVAALAAWPVVILWWTRLWITSEIRSRRGSTQEISAARRAGLRAAIDAWREIR